MRQDLQDKSRAWRIVLIDDHPLIRDAYGALLATQADMKVIGCFRRSRELMTAMRTMSVDVVLLDYRLADEDADGVLLIQCLRARFPSARLLVCSALDNTPTVAASLYAGAHGFLSKGASLDECVRAVRVVAGGLRYVKGTVSSRVSVSSGRGEILGEGGVPLGLPLGLSVKEFDVLRCCLQGLMPSDIGVKFHRSIKTVSGHKLAACRKLGITTDPQLFRIRAMLDGL